MLSELLISLTITALISLVLIAVLIASLRVWRASSSLSQAFPPAYNLLSRVNTDLMSAAYVRIPAMWASGNYYKVNDLVICSFDVVDPTDPQGRTKRVYKHYRCTYIHTASGTNKPLASGTAGYWATSYPWIIVYQMKLDDDDDTPTLPLEANLNGVRQYYLSDTSGTLGNAGTCLWCRTFTQNTNNTITQTANRILANNVAEMSFNADSSANAVLKVNSIALSFVGQEKNQQTRSSFSSTIAFRNPPVVNIPPMPTIP